MQSLSKLLSRSQYRPNRIHHDGIAARPQEFLKVHRVNIDVHLLRRYEYVFDVFLYGYQRSGFHIVETSVFHKVLYCLTRAGEALDLVEHHQRPSLDETNLHHGFEHHEESVKVVQIVVEQILHVFLGLAEVNQDIGIVFGLGKLLGKPAFADSPSAVKHKSISVRILGLPLKHLVIGFSFHDPPFFRGYYITFLSLCAIAIIHFFEDYKRFITTPF